MNKDNQELYPVQYTMYDNIVRQRTYVAVKANVIVRARFNLKLQQIKALNYIISLIKPDDDLTQEKCFKLIDFCRVCGIAYQGGANYKYVRDTLKDLADQSVYVPIKNEAGEVTSETLVRWLVNITCEKKTGIVRYQFHEKMIPFIHHLHEHFTEFQLANTLPMKSQYSIRIYELLKSYESLGLYEVTIEELKRTLGAESYNRWPDFRRYVLEKASEEINKWAHDIKVKYDTVKYGRKVVAVRFHIKSKDAKESVIAMADREEALGDGGVAKPQGLTIVEIAEMAYGPRNK